MIDRIVLAALIAAVVAAVVTVAGTGWVARVACWVLNGINVALWVAVAVTVLPLLLGLIVAGAAIGIFLLLRWSLNRPSRKGATP